MATVGALSDTTRQTILKGINQTLPRGWEAKMMSSGRLYYLDHSTRKSQWLPPTECWPLKTHLPYGWEPAITDQSKQYYINHLTSITTSCHPHLLQTEEPTPIKRLVTLGRDSIHGFGFIAGSEAPVVVRSVSEGGPSASKLLPGDQILEIAGEDVTQSKRMYIIDKIMGATEAVQMLVTQPNLKRNDGIKSSFLSHNKKQRLMARPLRVKFADNIKTFSPNPKVAASLSYLPNILKVYLENGQTKSFRYDGNTTVKTVLESISTKLGIESPHHFALVTEDVRQSPGQKFHILSEDLTLRQVSSEPESQYWRCLYRLTFPPKDPYQLLLLDNAAFEYFYQQCRSDVISDRLGSELKFDLALRLASLSVQQHFMRINKKSIKVSTKMLQKQDGLELFLPRNILENYKSKELRKQICLHLKQNQTFTPPGQKCLSEVQAKLHYLRIIAELPSYACRTYSTMTTLDSGEKTSRAEFSLVVSAKHGICRVHNGENVLVMALEQLERVVLSKQPHIEATEIETACQIEISCTDGEKHQFMTSNREGVDFVHFVCGLYKVYVDREKIILSIDNSRVLQDPNSDIPKYCGQHLVIPSGWNYPDPEEHPGFEDEIDFDNIIDLTDGPPEYVTRSDRSSGLGTGESGIVISISGVDSDVEISDDTGSVASLSDTLLSLTSEEDSGSRGRESVISLTDMSFDIHETQDEKGIDAADGGEPKMSKLLVILNEESKDALDGTAKLRMRRSPGEAVRRTLGEAAGRKTSIESSECSSVSSFSLYNPEYTPGDLESPEEGSVISPFHPTEVPDRLDHDHAWGYIGGDEGGEAEDESMKTDEEDLPVSMIDLPSPDPISSSDESPRFEYHEAGTPSQENSSLGAVCRDFLERNLEALDLTIQNIKTSVIGGDVAEDASENRSGEEDPDRLQKCEDELSDSGSKNESLESIAASFQATDDNTCSGQRDRRRSSHENPHDLESLDDLEASFSVDPGKGDVTNYHVESSGTISICKDKSGRKETLQGLVEALIEMSNVVEHDKCQKQTKVTPSYDSDENGNFENISKGGAPKILMRDMRVTNDHSHPSEDNSENNKLQSEIAMDKEGSQLVMVDSLAEVGSLDVLAFDSLGSNEYLTSDVSCDSRNNSSSAYLGESVDKCLSDQLDNNPTNTTKGDMDNQTVVIGGPSSGESQRGEHQNGNVSGVLIRTNIHTNELTMNQSSSTISMNASAHPKTTTNYVRQVGGEEVTYHESAGPDVAKWGSDHDVGSVVNEESDSVGAVLSSVVPASSFGRGSPRHKFEPHSSEWKSDHDARSVVDEDSDSGDAVLTPVLPTPSIGRVSPRRKFEPHSLDEAHGIQLAALLALDASLEEKNLEHPRVPRIRDEEGSDSGNETISSECVDGPSGEEAAPPLGRGNGSAPPLIIPPIPHEYLGLVPGGFIAESHEVEAAALIRFSDYGIPIDMDTLESMRTVLLSNDLLDEATGTTGNMDDFGESMTDSMENISLSNEVRKEGDMDNDSSENEDNSINSFIGSLSAVLPPPQFNDSLSEDLLPVIPPPNLDGLSKYTKENNTNLGCVDLGGDSERITSLEGGCSGEEQQKSETVSLSDVPQQVCSGMDGNATVQAESSTVVESIGQGKDSSVPTPPPRKRSTNKGFGPRAGPKSSSCKERNVNGPVVKRSMSASFTQSEVGLPLGSSEREALQDKAPSRHRAIGDSLSKVFTPGKTWNSLKESLKLSSKPRTRTSLKSLWPETTSSCFEDKFLSKSMENMADCVKDVDPLDTSTKVQSPRANKSSLQRCKSLGGDIDNILPETFMADELSDGTVVFSAEFWRKARLSAPPSPGRPAPPIPDSQPSTSLKGRSIEKNVSPGDDNDPSTDDDGSGSDTSTPPPLPPSEPPGSSSISNLNTSPPRVIPKRRRRKAEGNGMPSQDILDQLEQKEYNGVDAVTDAYMDIQVLCHTLEVTRSDSVSSGVAVERFNRLKERLMLEIREFTGSSKALVTSFNHPAARMALAMTHCLRTLTRLVKQGQQIVWSLHSDLIASRLKHKICDLADHFTTMLQLVVEARGQASNSSVIQDVLRQAQTMAVLLSSLMRSVRMMQNYKQVGDKIII